VPQNRLLIQSDPAAAKSIHNALIYSDDGPFQVDWVRTHAEGMERLVRLRWSPKKSSNCSHLRCIV
jgi:hypothetical protein